MRYMYERPLSCSFPAIITQLTANSPMLNRYFILILLFTTPSLAVDFLFNSFTSSDLIFTGDARVESSVVTLTSDSNRFSMGRAFYPNSILRRTSNSSTIPSFSTSFVFSILPRHSTDPGFGLAFLISNSTVPAGALSGQYFGLFTNLSAPSIAPLLVVEFDTGRNPEFNDPNANHVGINLNNAESVATQSAGYYNSTTGELIPINMRSGNNIRAWIEFDGNQFGVNVTIAPVGVSRPPRPLISFYDPVIANYVDTTMFVGFSASKTTWEEAHRVLAWSLTDEGVGRVARDINISNLPNFPPDASSSSSISSGFLAGAIVISSVILIFFSSGLYCLWLKKRSRQEEDEEEKVQDWELEYWPHRFSYEELVQATRGFSEDELLGSGGFGRVYKGVLANQGEVAVKCVNHDSNQGCREFMAEISSIGRLQHKNLVHMRGWCKKGRELMLVYDYMPNGSVYRWIFGKSNRPMGWQGRLQALLDVAEGLNYLHHGWDHLVLHRDIKSSNVLLDSDMRARLGDFGLAKLYKHGQAPVTTRLVGTIGYMAPELVHGSSTAASDVYSFGVMVVEVACGRRPTDASSEDEPALIKWVGKLADEGRIHEAADSRIAGEYRVEDMEMVLKLGLACSSGDPQLRPTMKEVVSALMDVVGQAYPHFLITGLQPGCTDVASDDASSSIMNLSGITDPSPRT